MRLSLYGKVLKRALAHPAAVEALTRVSFAWRHVYMFAVGALKGIDPNKVVFSSFMANSYADNPRYVSEALHDMAPDVKQVWLFRDDKIDKVKVPDYVVKAHAIGLDGITHLATARVWVDNVKKQQSLLFRPKKQVYFNTWHGDRGFKRVGRDNKKLPNWKPRTERFCTAMIAGSEFGRNTYRTAFDFQGEVLMDGCPKNDILVRDDPDTAVALRREMGIPRDVKLMIYAPTYRDDLRGVDQRAPLNLSQTLDWLEEKTGDRWLCLKRAHYLSHGIDAGDGADRIIDMTGWPEMAELLAVSDMLISDYSSCAGDFILRNKPAILYQSDADQYRSDSREFYFDMDTAPFFIARDMSELKAVIDGLTEESILENCRRWREFFGVTETGHASEASARYILDAMKRG